MELIRTADGGVVLTTCHERLKTEGKPPPAELLLSNLDSSVAKEGWLRQRKKWSRSLAGETGRAARKPDKAQQ